MEATKKYLDLYMDARTNKLLDMTYIMTTTNNTQPIRWFAVCNTRASVLKRACHIAHAAYGLTRKGSQGWRRQATERMK